MHISVINQQSGRKLNQTAIRRLTGFLLEKSGKRAGIKWGDVSVVLVDNKESLRINQAHLGHGYATDVISFNFDPIPGEPESGMCGEIVVNVEQACRLGKRYGGPDHELALYIAHGCDHLSGEDDNTPARRQRMRRRELRWVNEGLRGEGVKGPRPDPYSLNPLTSLSLFSSQP